MRAVSISAKGGPPPPTTSPHVATVFGSTGFSGRYVANRLAQKGTQLVVPFRGQEKSTDHLKPMGDVGQIVPLRISIRDKASIDKAVQQSSVVVNMLGKHYETRNFSFKEANAESAHTIATAAKKAGVQRLIHISLVGAEERASSEWKSSKAASEKAVRDAFPDATILRCTTMFGSEDRLINKYGYLSMISSRVFLPINPKTKIQPLYVRDLASAVMAVISNVNSAGRTYELGGPDVFTVEDMLNNIIFPGTKRPNRIVPLRSPFAEGLAKVAEQFRDPQWLSDELKFFEEDNVVGKTPWTLASLGITPTPMKDVAESVLRQYKRRE